MCKRFFDVRAFGAVMSTGPNAGQVRGPIQLTFSRSVDSILTQEHAITRMAVATADEAEKQGGDNRTMGRKNTIPYGLYVGHGFVSAKLAQQTGFTDEDLTLTWQALQQMFEHDRSAARGMMALRKLIVFKHASELGNAPAHALFDLVQIKRKDLAKPARAFADYDVAVGTPPDGVEAMQLV
jgi:CRISPR-associated protein Csd2